MHKESEGKANALSALVDGELDGDAAAAACAHWRDDAQARAEWHAYHLIGDVMRSEELAATAVDDSLFLQRLRVRLVAEPVVLAPQPVAVFAHDRQQASGVAEIRRSSWSWKAPAAVAAGFMAIASVLVVTGTASPFGETVSTLAQAVTGKASGPVSNTPQPGDATTLTASASGEPQTFVADGKLVRDARLERYFAAHSQFGGSSALGVPSGFMRAATTQPPER